MWKQKELSKTVKQKTSTKYIFEYAGDKVISNIQTSCGCSKAKYDPETKKMQVTYKADKMPRHLLGQPTPVQKVTKYVTVIYADSTKDVLSIKALITM